MRRDFPRRFLDAFRGAIYYVKENFFHFDFFPSCDKVNKMTNRNPVKQWSITFPQCGANLERKVFADTFPPRDACIVAREEHEDGGFHLHLGLKLKKGITKTKLLAWIQNRWPNDYMRIDVQATRSISQWNDYLGKEDPQVYEEKDEKVVVRKDTIEEMQGIIMRDVMDALEAQRARRWVNEYLESGVHSGLNGISWREGN